MQFLLLVGKQPHPSHLNTKKQQRDNHKQHLQGVSNAVSQLLFMVVSLLFYVVLCCRGPTNNTVLSLFPQYLFAKRRWGYTIPA